MFRSSDEEYFGRLRALVVAESTDGESLVASIEDNPVCAVFVDESIPAVVIEWRRYATSAQFRYVHERVIRLLQDRGLTKTLGDDTALPMIHAEDQAWVTQEWMPRAAALGWKASANKAPTAGFGSRCVDSVRTLAPEGVLMRTFADLTECKRWLRSLPV